MEEPKLDPKRSALLLLDMINDVVKSADPARRKVIEDARIIENSARAMGLARRVGMPIVLVRHEWRKDSADLSDTITDLLLQGKGRQYREIPGLREGTPGVQVVDELAPGPEDFVFAKRRVDAFFGTPLEIYLRARRISTLVIGGFATNITVESTGRSARDRDFNVIFLKDCSAAFTQEEHDWCCNIMFPRLGRVRTVDEVARLLE